MCIISLSSRRLRDKGELVSQLVLYPDGTERILSMRPHEWDWVALAEKHSFPFSDVLVEAIGMAHEFPSDRGYDADVLDQTRRMLRAVWQLIEERKRRVSNDSFKKSG